MTDAPNEDDVKKKFREAVERKRAKQQDAHDEGEREAAKIHGAHGPASQKRSFRRKSG